MGCTSDPVSAASPEELDTLLEDALLMGDGAAVSALFAGSEALVAAAGCVRHSTEAVELLSEHGYLASPSVVRVGSGIALAIGERAVAVSGRGAAGRWQLLAVVLPCCG